MVAGTARIKQVELDALADLAKKQRRSDFMALMDNILRQHGCAFASHYVNEQGYIMQRMDS